MNKLEYKIATIYISRDINIKFYKYANVEYIYNNQLNNINFDKKNILFT